MTDLLVLPDDKTVSFCGHQFPKLITDAGPDARRRFIEFFTANIRNKNTRDAYARSVAQFCAWCEDRKFSLELLEPVVVATYVEALGKRLAKPSVKQHLAAIRMLFDYLVVGQIIPLNPAASVRGPKYVVKRGKTPALSAEDSRPRITLPDSAPSFYELTGKGFLPRSSLSFSPPAFIQRSAEACHAPVGLCHHSQAPDTSHVKETCESFTRIAKKALVSVPWAGFEVLLLTRFDHDGFGRCSPKSVSLARIHA